MACKVDSLIEKYDLDSIVPAQTTDEYLANRWTGENDYSEAGVRQLKDWFNKRVIKRVYSQHGIDTVDTRIESDYDVLMGEDNIAYGDLSEMLSSYGIDTEELRNELVSTATMYRHLTNCIGESKPHRELSSPESYQEAIEKSLDAVEQYLKSVLSATGVIDSPQDYGTEVEARISITVRCPDCNEQVTLEQALENPDFCKCE